jgi:hypothetical protein
MKRFKNILAILLISCIITLFISACGNSPVKIPLKYSELPKIGYCDLPKYENKEAILTSKFEGMMEYWSLQPINPCEQDLSVEFDTHDYYKMPKYLKERLNRRAKYFIVTAVGRYEKSNKKGYGHLNTLKSRFIVTDLLDVEVISYPMHPIDKNR